MRKKMILIGALLIALGLALLPIQSKAAPPKLQLPASLQARILRVYPSCDNGNCPSCTSGNSFGSGECMASDLHANLSRDVNKLLEQYFGKSCSSQKPAEDTQPVQQPNQPAEDSQLVLQPNQPAEDTPLVQQPNQPAEDTPLVQQPNHSAEDTPLVLQPNHSAEDTPLVQQPSADQTAVTVQDLTYEEQVVALVNAERAKVGLPTLVSDAKLQEAALARAKETVNLFSHTRPNGTSCFTILKEFGISYRSAGENIAYGQRSPEEVVNAWMNSEGHRANILSKNFTTIGIGYYQTANGTKYWSQLFTS